MKAIESEWIIWAVSNLPIVDYLERMPIEFQVPPKGIAVPDFAIDYRPEALEVIRSIDPGWVWPRRELMPEGLCIHHSAGWLNVNSTLDSAARRGLDTEGVPYSYHFVVTEIGTTYFVTGGIAYHNGGSKDPDWDGDYSEANAKTLGICLIGDFRFTRPSAAQLRSARLLIQFYDLPVSGHLDWTDTVCPGDTWSSWKSELMTNDDMIREAAWNAAGIAYNPSAAFFKYAARNGLGRPVTDEFDIRGLRVQGFDGGIVYAKIHEWEDIKHINWLPEGS